VVDTLDLYVFANLNRREMETYWRQRRDEGSAIIVNTEA
jgi:hypothetical protein